MPPLRPTESNLARRHRDDKPCFLLCSSIKLNRWEEKLDQGTTFWKLFQLFIEVKLVQATAFWKIMAKAGIDPLLKSATSNSNIVRNIWSHLPLSKKSSKIWKFTLFEAILERRVNVWVKRSQRACTQRKSVCECSGASVCVPECVWVCASGILAHALTHARLSLVRSHFLRNRRVCVCECVWVGVWASVSVCKCVGVCGCESSVCSHTCTAQFEQSSGPNSLNGLQTCKYVNTSVVLLTLLKSLA